LPILLVAALKHGFVRPRVAQEPEPRDAWSLLEVLEVDVEVTIDRPV
jgi:hypothetical protein